MANLINYYYDYNHIVVLLIIVVVFGSQAAYAVPYDPTFILDCLATPPPAQYGGGMVVNPELNQGLKGWRTFGDAKVEHVLSDFDGNKYILSSNRNLSHHRMAQRFYFQTGLHYSFSVWLRVSHGKAHVKALFKTGRETRYENAGSVVAQNGCWSMLKGGLVAKKTGLAHLYFKTNTAVDIMADSISLQSFTPEEWVSHRQQRIEKVRKRRVRLHAVDEEGRPMANMTVSLIQTRPGFPFGCAINKNILTNPGYQNWFLSRFQNRYTVFENELKWYSTEWSQGVEDYTTADAMMKFSHDNGLKVRAHNVLWDNKDAQPRWVNQLSQNDLWAAANRRVNSVVGRYRGQVIHWDVVNENMHYNFFETALNNLSASAYFYGMASQIDPYMLPFLNEFNTIENGDPNVTPDKYLAKIGLLRQQGYNGKLAIGLQSHFTPYFFNLVSVRAKLEMLAQAGLPIWATELDVASGPSQASDLDQILQEFYANPAVQGIIIWSPWVAQPQGCYAMCLTDDNFGNLETGNVVDRFISQLTQAQYEDDQDDLTILRRTDADGFFETTLPAGVYEVKITHHTLQQFSSLRRIRVRPRKHSALSSRPQTHRFTIKLNP